ncbi:hypothetical protein Aduo_013336 [Ancylostoma duodenale]
MMTETPQVPIAVQGRKGKKHRIDFESPHEDKDFDRAVDLIVKDQSLPPLVKTAFGFMVEMKQQTGAVIARNQQLLEENSKLHQQNNELQNEVQSLRSQIDLLKSALSNNQTPPPPPLSHNLPLPMSHEGMECKRSVVVVGAKESSAPISSARVLHDLVCPNCEKGIK